MENKVMLLNYLYAFAGLYMQSQDNIHTYIHKINLISIVVQWKWNGKYLIDSIKLFRIAAWMSI